ncbi:hypothetical protein [Bradyrhizobium embrapense]
MKRTATAGLVLENTQLKCDDNHEGYGDAAIAAQKIALLIHGCEPKQTSNTRLQPPLVR